MEINSGMKGSGLNGSSLNKVVPYWLVLTAILLVSLSACSFGPASPEPSLTAAGPSQTPTSTATLTPSSTPTDTPTPTPTATPTPTPTFTPTPLLLALPETPLPESLAVINIDNAAQVSGLAEWQEQTVTDFAWAPDSKTLAVATLGGISLYDVRLRRQVRALYPKGGGVISIAFSPDGAWLVSGSQYGSEQASFAGNIQLWQGPYWRPLGILFGEERAVSGVTFSPDGKYLAIAFTSTDYNSNDVQFRLANTWEISTTLKTGTALKIAFSPAGNLLASVPDRYATKLWRVKDGELIDTIFTAFTNAVSSLAFSPGGTFLATGHYDGTIRIWDLRTFELLLTMASDGVVNSLAFSPDGRLLASGDSYHDNSVRLWAADSGDLLRTLPGHTHGVEHLTFSPDGQMIVSGSYDGTVRLWGIRP